MSPRPVSDQELAKAVRAVRAAGGNKSRAARQLQMSRDTLNSRLVMADARGIAEDGSAQRPLDTLRDRALTDENLLLKRSIAELERQIVAERRWHAKFSSLDALSDQGARWFAKPAVRKKKSEHVVQLFTSDFHVGEKITPAELDGINEYNQDVFCQRYQRMIDTTIDLATNYTGLANVSGLVYLAGGDAISGAIHEELAETNDLSSVPAIRLLCLQEREGIRKLRDRFGHVKVYRIPGNHGRTTRKPRSKEYVEHSFETLLSWWLAASFDDDPKVEFFVPPSGDAYYDVLGWKFLLSHGDRMGSRGGQGFVGPAATIARGHARLHSNYASTRKPLDWVLTGHLHTELKLERGFGNGSLAGYSQYARDLRATPDAARQWMFLTHPDRPMAHMFSIQLSKMPQRTEMITD